MSPAKRARGGRPASGKRSGRAGAEPERGPAHHYEAAGVGLLALGLLLILAVFPPWWRPAGAGNLIGPAGDLLWRGLTWTAGWGGLFVVLPPLAWGLYCFELIDRRRALGWTALAAAGFLLLPAGAGLLSRGSVAQAGWVGQRVAAGLQGVFGTLGGVLIVFAVLVALSVLALAWSPAAGMRGLARWTALGGRVVADLFATSAEGTGTEAAEEEAPSHWEAPAPEEGATTAPADGAEEPEGEPVLADYGDLTQTELPPTALLTVPPSRSSGLSDAQLRSLGEVLIQKLSTFRVEGRIAGWTTGPVVTQFEVVPAAGVKVGQIAALSDDLALALKAPSVRIVAPIPGKGAVGVEVPNPEPEIVYLREVLEAPAYQRSRAELPLALGRDLAGSPYCADLSRMPHLLIAGATGSGKSICINTIITSLIYRYTPAQLRLLMVDPKMVELIVYNDLPHLRHPVVTDNEEAASILKWAVFEMNRRYALLSANACRNLEEFNLRVAEGDPIRSPAGAEREYRDGELPFIVLVIDELADLMMTVQSDVEGPLAMLAQKARAVGMHLVVATQRPSVNVVTGLIKANFPSRIAFRVASKTDSRTILDQNGAESLLGNGDLLFLPPGEADPVRIQGAFLTSRDTERLVGWYRERAARREEAAAGTGEGERDILEVVREMEEAEARVDIVEEVLEDRDELFRQAAEIVITNDSGSTSLLQRRLRIGYGRAARIVDQLHHAGVLGPSEGSRPREVLVGLDELDGVLRRDGSADAG